MTALGREPGPTRRPRTRTFRRWVVRPLVWAVAVLALLVAGATALLDSALFRERVRILLATQLAELLGRSVSIGALELDLLPLSIELKDVTVAGPGPGDRPFAVARRLLIEGDLADFRDPVLRLRSIEIESPTVDFELDEDGHDNIPRLRAGAGGRRRLRIEVAALAIRGGVLRFGDHRLPLDLAARDVGADLLATSEASLSGSVEADEVEVTLPRARPYAGRLVAQVQLDTQRLRILSARARGPGLSADVEGEVEWVGQPRVALRIAASGGTELFEQLGYLSGQVEGPWRFAGDLAWQPAGWFWQGAVTSDALRVLNWPLTAASGQAKGGPRSVHVELEQATYHGGRIAGTLDVDLSEPHQPTSVALDLAGADAAAALADLQIPVTAISSRLAGSIGYRFTFADAGRGDGEIDLTFEPASGGGAALALAGSAPFSIVSGVLQTEGLRLADSNQVVIAKGSYDLSTSSGSFDWRVDSTAIGALGVLLPASVSAGSVPLWLPSRGSGTLSGTLTLVPAATVARIELALRDASAPGFSAASATGGLTITEDAVQDLVLTLERPGGEIRVAGAVPLSPRGAELALAIDARAWPLEEARPWLPAAVGAWPLGGAFSGRVTVAGASEALRGTVDGRLADAVWGERAGFGPGRSPLGDLTTRFAFDAERLTVEHATLSTSAGEVSLSGTVAFARGELDLKLEAPSVALGSGGPLAGVVGGGLAGVASVSAVATGTLERPEVRASLAARDLALSGEVLGDSGVAAMEVNWAGGSLQVEGSLLGLIEVSGGGALTRERADLRLALSTDALHQLADLAVVAPLPEFSGSAQGELTIAGPLNGQSPPSVGLRLPELRIDYLGRRLLAKEPVLAAWRPQTLTIESLYLQEGSFDAGSTAPRPSGEETELFLNGAIGLGGEGQDDLDLHVQATVAASWLSAWTPTVRPFGTVEALATVKGTLARPLVNGQGGVRDGRLIVLGFPHALEDLSATVLFYSDAMVLDSFAARLGGGTLQASGRLDLPRTGAEAAYRVQASARSVTLRYPEGWLVRGNADLVWASSAEGRQLRGDIVLDRAYYFTAVKVGITDLLRSALVRKRAQVAATDPFLATTQLGISVRAAEALRVRNNLANLRGSADLMVRGTLAVPVVFGRVEIEPGGTLVYAENEYRVERAVLTFANPYRIEPVVDVVATTEVKTYDVTLNLAGTLDRLSATFASDPPIADLEILSLLATGDASTLAETATASGVATLPSGSAEAFLAGQAASLIGERVNRLLGFDKFQVAPLQVGGDAVSSVRVTVGKRLGKNVYATYSVDPAGTLDQYLTLEWRVSPAMSLVLTQTGTGAYSVDARWEKAF